jgi:hypothetical protein
MNQADLARPPAHVRGYGRAWRKVRAEVLRAAGIPEGEWHNYVVDHRPRYNPTLEPDHWKYELVPMLRSSHSSKTASQDGAFGRGPKAVWRHNLPKPGELFPEAIYLQRRRLDWDDWPA